MARASLGILLVLFTLAAGCTRLEDAAALVKEADDALTGGGIEDAKVRELAAQKYDRAIRIVCGDTDYYCVKGKDAAVAGDDAHTLSHAHFGLAFARSFDLIDRIRQLYVSDTLFQTEILAAGDEADADDGEAPQTTTADRCEQQQNLQQLVPLLRTIVRTSLLPIIDSLKTVTRFKNFSISYEKAFLNLSFLDPSLDKAEQADLTRRDIGFYFGASEEDPAIGAGLIGLPEVHLILGVFRVLTLGAETVFAYNDLTQALIVFGGKFVLSDQASPYVWARALNSDECTDNPLFDPSFGVLSSTGRDNFSRVKEQLDLLLSEQAEAMALLAARGEPEASAGLLNYRAGGSAWADNLFRRIMTADTAASSLSRVMGVVSTLVTPEDVAELFTGLDASLGAGTPFDVATYLDSKADLAQELRFVGIEPLAFGLPAVNLYQFFNNPIADLKGVAPLTYAESEPTSLDQKPGYENVLSQERPAGIEKKSFFWRDVNGDRRLNVRGDFIIQPEREAFYDSANNNTPSGTASNLGILGTFWDADANGIPDEVEGYALGVTPGVSRGASPYAVTAAVFEVAGDVVVELFANAGTTAPEAATYRNHFVRDNAASTGCLVKPVLNVFNKYDCDVRVGDVLGHVWPNVYPEAYAAPGVNDTRRRDPANGAEDRIYFFFPNPSFNGVLLKARGAGYDSFANEDLNRFLNNVLGLSGPVNDLIITGSNQ